MSEYLTEVDGTNNLKELLCGIVDAIKEIAEDSHSYLIVDGRVEKLRTQAKKLNLEIVCHEED